VDFVRHRRFALRWHAVYCCELNAWHGCLFSRPSLNATCSLASSPTRLCSALSPSAAIFSCRGSEFHPTESLLPRFRNGDAWATDSFARRDEHLPITSVLCSGRACAAFQAYDGGMGKHTACLLLLLLWDYLYLPVHVLQLWRKEEEEERVGAELRANQAAQKPYSAMRLLAVCQ